jgi:HD-GYP domain-containing protein (c-di-GMP phosphodiesterase class II)
LGSRAPAPEAEDIHAAGGTQRGSGGYFSSIEGWVEATPLTPNKEEGAPSEDASAQKIDALIEHGLHLRFKAQFQEALNTFQQAYEAALHLGDAAGLVFALAESGWTYFHQDAPSKALVRFREADTRLSAITLSLVPSDANGRLHAAALRLRHYMALTQYRQQSVGEAMALLRMLQQQAAPGLLDTAKLDDSWAYYYMQSGQHALAKRHLRQALDIKRRCPQTHETVTTLELMAKLDAAIGDTSTAVSRLEEAYAITMLLGARHRCVEQLLDMASFELADGDLAALPRIQERLAKVKTFKDLTDNQTLKRKYLQAWYLLRSKQLGECDQLLQQSVLPRARQVPGMEARARRMLGILYRIRLEESASGKGRRSNSGAKKLGTLADRGLQEFQEASRLFHLGREFTEEAATLLELARFCQAADQPEQALDYLTQGLKLAENLNASVLAEQMEEELYRLDPDQWRSLVQQRVNGEPLFERDRSLFDALSALSEKTSQLADSVVVEDTAEESSPLKVRSLLSLLRVGQAMAAENELDKLLQVIRDETERALDADRCTVFLLDPEKDELWSKVASGFKETEEIRFPAYMGLAGHVAKTGETLNIKDAYSDPRFNPDIDKQTGYKTHSLLCMPMWNRTHRVMGVFQVLNKRDAVGQWLPFDEADIDLLMAISASAGTALENAILTTNQKTAFESFIKTLSSTIDARDPITAGHSERVAGYAELMGCEMRLGDGDLEALKYASLLHDIGKIGIREEILVKDGRLTAKEYLHIQKHAYYTYEILKNIHFDRHLASVPEIAASHHEKMDGSGYFRGLRGPEIPLSGRIMAVGDVFDAITSRRHYRNRMPFERALHILRRDAGGHFDPDCVSAFFNLRLYDLGQVLIQDPNSGSYAQCMSYLKRFNREVTIGAFEALLNKPTKTRGEQALISLFNSFYRPAP